MSVHLSSGTSKNNEVERRYQEQDDRLFLIYYALPPGFNNNKWAISPTSLDRNIRSAINKPVIIYRKNPSNPFHTHQAGNFVHPTLDEAASELGHPVNEEQYYNWQEKFAVGRIRNVEKRQGKGYAFTLEITDPEAKNILKSEQYRTGIPGWTSPQILTNARLYPNEERTGLFDHWTISHIILTDSPAYGYDKASLKAKCVGEEKECLLKTKSASQENLGFCVKQATLDLLNSHSSHDSLQSTPPHTTMSSNETQPVIGTSTNNTGNEVVITKTFSEQNPKNDSSGVAESIPEEQQERERNTATDQEDPNKISLPKTLEEAHKFIVQLVEQNKTKDEMLRSTQKEMKNILKWKDQIEHERRVYRLKSTIPRDLYKSDEAHDKEVARIIEKGLDSDLEFLKGHYELMRQARLAAEQTAQQQVPQLKAKSASLQHEVPDYTNKDGSSKNNRSTIDKQLELQNMILEGGGI